MSLRATLAVCLVLVSAAQGGPPAWMPRSGQCDFEQHPGLPITEPSTDPEPTLPKLPDQYSLKVEANIYQKQRTTEVEEHYDYPNKRASASFTNNGTTVWSYFDYTTDERYDVYPNGSCFTHPAAWSFLGFTRYAGQNVRPVMATINEVLSFGTNFNQTYRGKADVRGIPVDHWTACQEWSQMGTKFQLDWYFSRVDYQTASGHSQIPIRAVVNGYARNVASMSQPMSQQMRGNHTFQHVYEFVSFRSGPALNEDVFEIPPGINCQGRKISEKERPQLPDTFEMSMEIVIPNSIRPPMQEFLRYDYENKLVETWYQMTIPQAKLNGAMRGNEDIDVETLVTVRKSVVEDHKNKVVYHLDKINLTCTVSAMEDSSDSITMMHGSSLLFIDSNNAPDLQYQGQTTIREMKVDVWGLEQNGVTQQIYFLPPKDPSVKVREERSASQAPPSAAAAAASPWGSSGSGAQVPPQWARQSGGQQGPPAWASQGGTPPPAWANQGGTPRVPGAWARGGAGMTTPKPGKMTKPPGTRSKFPYYVPVGMYFRNSSNAGQGDDSQMKLLKRTLMNEAMNWATATEQDITSPQGSSGPIGPMHPVMQTEDLSEQVAWGRRLQRLLDANVGEKLINIFHYHPEHLESINFQVAVCFPPTETSRVMLTVMANFQQDVLHYYAAFINSVRQAIAKSTGLSSLQISDLMATPLFMPSVNMDATSLTFTLLGRPRLEGTKQTTVQEAKKKLADAIGKGIPFTVEYLQHSKGFLVDKKAFTMDYDKVDTANLMSGKTMPGGAAPAGKDKAEEGYSSAAMAGISIMCLLLGIALCLGVAYAIHKYRRPGQSFAPYKMT